MRYRYSISGSTRAEGRGLITSEVVNLSVSTYKRAAYLAIRDMIVELEIPPGARLVETDLAARLNVSKTPIREAVALLEADGLVDITPYRGATVRWLSTLEMEEQRFLIDAIELPAFPLVVERITRPHLAELGQVIKKMKRARVKNDGPAFRRLTSSTHAMLFAPVRYPRLNRFVTVLIGLAASAMTGCSLTISAILSISCSSWPWAATSASRPETLTAPPATSVPAATRLVS